MKKNSFRNSPSISNMFEHVNFMGILSSENPKFYQKMSQKRYVPLVKLLRLIIDEKSLHYHLSCLKERSYKKDGLSPLENLIQFLYKDCKVHIKVVGKENLPKQLHSNKSLIFASNHTLGMLDGLALVESLSKMYGHAYILANRLAMLTEIFNTFFIPVGVFTRTSREEKNRITKLYEGKDPICIFPAGLVGRKDAEGNLKESPWKKHFIQKAIEFKRDIVPTYVRAENSKLFYGIHKLRTRLNIRTNFEMFLLVRETFNVKNKPITIHFGRPIAHQKISEYIKSRQNDVSGARATQELADQFCVHVESQFQKPLKL